MTFIIADFRSDTVTRPGQGMRQAMAAAEVGDDVYGDDPGVNRLEAVMAERSGKEAALFVPSGTQSNLIALLSHCQRGDEYIAGQEAHTYKFEAGGAAVLGSIQPQPIEFDGDGTLALDKVAAKIKADDCHFARTRLLCIENTQAGKALPLSYHARAKLFCQQHQLASHLDGARLFNASIEQAVELEQLTRDYDSVSICLSKGLGAPVGSLLCGERALIQQARRWRKMVGGGMRQAGILAAAGLYALEHNIERLSEDHANARYLARGLANLPGLSCDLDRVATNMLFVDFDSVRIADALRDYLRLQGILFGSGKELRLVTHLDTPRPVIDKTITACRQFLADASAV